MERVKEAFRSFMLRDLRPVEPDKKEGVRVGDAVRIHREKDTYVIRFLKGTEPKDREQYTKRLEAEGLKYKEGEDFTL